MVGGNLLTWKSKKQKFEALSSVKIEFRGISKGLCEVLWLRKLLADIGFPVKKTYVVKCDNKAAVSILENSVQHDRTKHVEIDRYFIREKLDARIVEFYHVRSEDQLADILTKAVTGKVFLEALSKLNVRDPTVPLEGE